MTIIRSDLTLIEDRFLRLQEKTLDPPPDDWVTTDVGNTYPFPAIVPIHTGLRNLMVLATEDFSGASVHLVEFATQSYSAPAFADPPNDGETWLQLQRTQIGFIDDLLIPDVPDLGSAIWPTRHPTDVVVHLLDSESDPYSVVLRVTDSTATVQETLVGWWVFFDADLDAGAMIEPITGGYRVHDTTGRSLGDSVDLPDDITLVAIVADRCWFDTGTEILIADPAGEDYDTVDYTQTGLDEWSYTAVPDGSEVAVFAVGREVVVTPTEGGDPGTTELVVEVRRISITAAGDDSTSTLHTYTATHLAYFLFLARFDALHTVVPLHCVDGFASTWARWDLEGSGIT